MHSFRYHLVSLCSIFIALALGLLLGAAIATSDVVQTTSDEMVESMLSRYESLVNDNARLENELQINSTLASSLTDAWSKERLSGRTIVVFLGNSTEDKSLRSDISETLKRASGSVVNVTVLQQDFRLGEPEVLEALKTIVEEVPEEDYQQTLARNLVREWSFVYVGASTQVSPDDLEITKHTYQRPSANDGAFDLDGGLEPETDFQKMMFNQYPLTRALLALGIISISTDYSALMEHTDPDIPNDQLVAMRIATAWQLPYGVNGLISGFAPLEGTATSQTQMGVQLALRMKNAASDERLLFPSWLKASIPKSTSGDVDTPNYFVVLIQPSTPGASMDVIASGNGLSCVTTPSRTSGLFSVVALLTGAQAGIYGENKAPEDHFAPMPQDSSGRAIFR